MKKTSLLLLTILLTGILAKAQTVGELTVSVSTSSAGGGYAPKNIVAIWIEDDAGNFVKTLLAYAASRKTHLNNWEATTTAAGSAYNTTDAISGATRSSHATRTCSWDGTDFEGTDSPDGTYYVWMELTDKNSTGNYSSFEFIKGENSDNLNPANEPSFGSISINWVPSSSVSVLENANKKTYSIFPNPGNGTFEIIGNNIKELEIRNLNGKLIHKSYNQHIDLSDQKDGIYLLYIINDNETVIKKLIKN